jgi:hypothetical protein
MVIVANGGGGGSAPPRVEANYSNDINWQGNAFSELQRSREGQQCVPDSHRKERLEGVQECKGPRNHRRVPSAVSLRHGDQGYPRRCSCRIFERRSFQCHRGELSFQSAQALDYLAGSRWHEGVFPTAVMVEGTNAVQAAQNWIASIVYAN